MIGRPRASSVAETDGDLVIYRDEAWTRGEWIQAERRREQWRVYKARRRHGDAA